MNFQYFLNDLGNFENLVQIWTRRPPNHYQNASTNTRQIMKSFWKNIIFANLGLKQIKFQKKYVLGTMFFLFVNRVPNFHNICVLKIGIEK